MRRPCGGGIMIAGGNGVTLSGTLEQGDGGAMILGNFINNGSLPDGDAGIFTFDDWETTDLVYFALSGGAGGGGAGGDGRGLLPPVAVNDFATAQNASVTIGVLANDCSQNGFPISVQSVTSAAHGSAVINSDGTITYTPSNGVTEDSFSYTITDASGETASATVSITINQAPNGLSVSNWSVLENQPIGTVVGTLSSTDPNTGDTAAYSLVSGAGSDDNSSFTISGNQLFTAASFNYEAKNQYAVRLRVTDSGGLTYDKVQAIYISDVLGTPIAGDVTHDVVMAGHSMSVSFNGLALAGDPGESLTYQIRTNPSHGTLAIYNNSFLYTPNSSAGAGDSFTYTVIETDSQGNSASAWGTITMRPDSAPVLGTSLSYTISRGSSINIPVSGLATDADVVPAGDTLRFSLGTPPTAGSVSLNDNGTSTYYADDFFRYSSSSGGSASGDSFTFWVNDLYGESCSGTITINLV